MTALERMASRWRVIATDSESLTGIAPVCTAGGGLHVIADYPGGPIRDEEGIYDCCPAPQVETYSAAVAEQLVTLLNAADTVTALLRAVHDALDLPLPDITDEDEQAHARLLTCRTAHARIIVAGVLEQDHEMAQAAETLCRWLADEPVTYTPWKDKGAPA